MAASMRSRFVRARFRAQAKGQKQKERKAHLKSLFS
jgi:hypothetical protein